MHIPLFKTGDKILITAVLLIAALVLAWNHLAGGEDGQLTAVITQDGRTIRQIDLNGLKDSEYIYLNNEFNQFIQAEKGRIRFGQSNCPNEVCVKTGWLTTRGDKAVCVPARTVITIEGDDGRADTLAY